MDESVRGAKTSVRIFGDGGGVPVPSSSLLLIVSNLNFLKIQEAYNNLAIFHGYKMYIYIYIYTYLILCLHMRPLQCYFEVFRGSRVHRWDQTRPAPPCISHTERKRIPGGEIKTWGQSTCKEERDTRGSQSERCGSDTKQLPACATRDITAEVGGAASSTQRLQRDERHGHTALFPAVAAAAAALAVP